MSEETIPDGEILLRRIPPGSPWLEPPNCITSANFKLSKHKNELGLSVYRESIVSAEAVLEKPDAKPGSFVVKATAREIRELRDGNGKPLSLDVIADEKDPGHAEIRSLVPGRISDSQSNALKRVFRRH